MEHGTKYVKSRPATLLPGGICRVSTVVVQRFCKPKVGGSNPSPGTRIEAS